MDYRINLFSISIISTLCTLSLFSELAEAQVKDRIIPKLSLSKQERLQPIELIPMRIGEAEQTVMKVEKRQSPQLLSPDSFSFDFKKAATLSFAKVPTQNFDDLNLTLPETHIKDTPVDSEKALLEWTDAQDVRIQALLFMELRKENTMAFSLLVKLLEYPEFKTEAHFYLGQVSRRLGLMEEFEHHMLLTLKEKNNIWSKQALEDLLKYGELESPKLQKELYPYLNNWTLTPEGQGQAHYVAGQVDFKNGNYAKAMEHFSLVSALSPFYYESKYLKALCHYSINELDEAIRLEKNLLAEVELLNNMDKIKSHVAINLARTLFQKGEYKDSYLTYLKVSPQSPLWIKALEEQAWSQLLAEDYASAAGNMYSLHTKFFTHAYKPESYIIRSIGYLSLCQYGDALSSIKSFKSIYVPVHKKVQTYINKNKNNPTQYYDTAKRFLKFPTQTEVDDLPDKVLIEIARHPEFIKIQKEINNIEDEWEAWLDLSKKLIEMERGFTTKVTELQLKEKKLKDELKRKPENKDIRTEIKTIQSNLYAARLSQQVAIASRKTISDLRNESVKRLTSKKDSLKTDASQILVRNLKSIEEDLNTLMTQSELISYEVYSGAGTHLRYQMSGGKALNEDKTPLLPESDSNQSWQFHGEFWLDEVGHYRSSLKNVCPKNNSGSM